MTLLKNIFYFKLYLLKIVKTQYNIPIYFVIIRSVINEKGKIWKIEISIPENTEIKENAKMYKFNYHLVDLKTGYGLPIYISINNCNYGETGKELDFSYDIQNLDEESRKEARNLIEKIKEANSDIKCEISSKEN